MVKTSKNLKTTVSYPARFASVLIILMLGLGVCCCQGALVSGLSRSGKSCCEKPAQPAHNQQDCHCAGKVLAVGKVEEFSGVPLSPRPAADLYDVFRSGLVRCGRLSLRGVPAVAHAPPPRIQLSILQVWLI